MARRTAAQRTRLNGTLLIRMRLNGMESTRSSCCVLEVPCLASLSALQFPGISQCPGIHWMDVSTHHSSCVACWLLLVCPWLSVVCGAASVRWLGLLTVSLWILRCYSRTDSTEDWVVTVIGVGLKGRAYCHRCRYASLCLDACQWSRLPSFSVCALGMVC